MLLDNDVNQVVAFAIWQQAQEGFSDSPEKAANEGGALGKIRRADRHTSNPDTEQVLNTTATLPKHQGRGCCSLLLSHALKQLDSATAKAFLKATPQGRPIYKRHGWREVDGRQVKCIALSFAPFAECRVACLLFLYDINRHNVSNPAICSLQALF